MRKKHGNMVGEIKAESNILKLLLAEHWGVLRFSLMCWKDTKDKQCDIDS